MPFRRSFRSLLFRTLRRAFQTDDGREIASDSLKELLAWRPRVPGGRLTVPYQDLARPSQAGADYSGTVFITARFRTGSTLLWNIFRHIDGCVSYYEPLNERRWFDSRARGNRIDSTHRGVDDYWREYEGLEDLARWYRDAWIDRSLLMSESDWDPDLRHYLDRMIQHAAPKRAVLQFNRVDFRLPWLTRQFPGAKVIHLYRHPRDQWCSTLMAPAKVPRDVTMDEFKPFDHYYLRHWARDLQHHFPFLSPRFERSPYRVFYFIWRLSFIYGTAFADYSLAFEQLTASPQAEIARLMDVVGLHVDAAQLTPLVERVSPAKWPTFADDAWFSAHEAACEEALSEFFRGDPETPRRPGGSLT